MIRIIACTFMAMSLTCCTSAGLIGEPPIVRFPVNPVNVTINRVIPRDYFFDNLVFTINDVETYKFGKEDIFKFSLGAGNYSFGYEHGTMIKTKCEVDVPIKTGKNYVYYLKPGCVIKPK